MELTEAHLRRLQRLLEEGFAPISFPLFPAHVGIQKYGCAAVLEPAGEGRLRIAAQPGLLLEGNISVLVEQGGEQWFVWKEHKVRATADLLDSVRRLEQELARLLEAPPS